MTIDQDKTSVTRDYKASPIGAKVGEDKRSLWGSSKLVVEVVAVGHLVNHLLVCKAFFNSLTVFSLRHSDP